MCRVDQKTSRRTRSISRSQRRTALPLASVRWRVCVSVRERGARLRQGEDEGGGGYSGERRRRAKHKARAMRGAAAGGA